jgi:hypothetical protein
MNLSIFHQTPKFKKNIFREKHRSFIFSNVFLKNRIKPKMEQKNEQIQQGLEL